MKKLIDVTATIKIFGCMIFSGLIIVYTVFSGFFGMKEISFGLIWQFLFISSLAALLHFYAFSGITLQRSHFTTRLIVFGVPLFVIICGFAIGFNWFTLNDFTQWMIFIGLYCFFFGIVTIVCLLYFKITGKKYAELLNAYQTKFD